MGWERRLLLDQETQSSDSATRRLLLPNAGKLSALEIRVACTNGATRGTERLFEAVDRVEVVADGSQIIASLEGTELYRWSHFWSHREPPHIWTEVNAAVQRLTFPLLFGRWLGDTEFSLNLDQYRDIELRLQYSPTIAATAFAAGTFQIHVAAYMSDDRGFAAANRGYLRTQQVRAFTTAAAGDDITELARAYQYESIMVYNREATLDDGLNITIAEVRANDRRAIPFFGRWDDIQAENEIQLSLDPEHEGILLVQDADTFDTHVGRIVSASLTPVFAQSDAAGIITANIAAIAGDRITVSASDTADAAAATHFTAAAARRAAHFTAKGLGVGNAILIPFMLGDNPDLALDAPATSRLQLALTQGNAGGECRVSTREIVPA